MPSNPFQQLLDQAGSVYGIDPGYWDIWGEYHTTPDAAKQAILRAKGMPAGSAAELELGLAERTRRERTRLLTPAVVVSESAEPDLDLNVLRESLGGKARITIRQEGGAGDPVVQFADLGGLPQTASTDIDGRSWVRLRLRLSSRLPLGYHEITVEAGDRTATTRYIVTPDRAYTPPHLAAGGRAAGIAVSLYGVRSARNWGCGDFSDLISIIDWVIDELDASFVALNPLHAIHNRRPFNTSPYLPN
jgi:hypothetical protein